MKIVKIKKIIINRKGIADNFLALLFVLLGLAIIFGGLFLFMYAKMKSSSTTIASDLNIKEGLYTTRILLNQEISPDYKVYNAIIDAVNSGATSGNSEIGNELYTAIKKFYPNGLVTDKWLVIINNNCFVIVNSGVTSSQTTVQGASVSLSAQGAQSLVPTTIDECEQGVIDKMPKVTVPNPDGENILVLFKPSSYLDGQTSRLFGYRADQMKGISSDAIPQYSADGRKLEQIQNIPNVVCDASDTSVGKICAADENLVQQLKVLSADKLQKDNMKIVITQAYRTYEIQKRLYDLNCDPSGCRTPTCNPDTAFACPHMQAGAIDISMYNSAGQNLNDINPQMVEDIMCSYGFVRFHEENWHFEYGTNQWDIAMEKRAKGEKVCVY